MFAVLVGSFASSVETWLLAGELAVVAAALGLSPVLGRPLALHIVTGSFIVYQTAVLDLTRATPNLGVVWFLLVPTWATLWGRSWHAAIWTPVTALAILWTAWRAVPSDPLWQHPLTLPNLLAVLLLSTALAVGFQRERARREQALADAVGKAERESAERESAEAKVRSAEHSRARLLAMLSHELRSPMTSLSLTADLLGDERESDEGDRTPIARLQQSAQATLRTLEDILDLVRLEDGVVPQRLAELSLLELLEDVAEVVAPHVRSGGVELVVDLDPSMADRWSADRARLRQVLLNLLGNALKHTREGAVRVRARVDEDGGGLRFDVEDTGVGIAEAVLDDVFEPYVRDGGSAAAVRGGVGLGLSISRDFVETMGGEIWVDSAAAGKTRLSFRVAARPCGDVRVRDVAPRPEHEGPVRRPESGAWQQARFDAWARAWGLDVRADEGAVVDLASSPEAGWRVSSLVRAIGGTLPTPTAAGPSLLGGSLQGCEVLVVDDDSAVREVVARVLERAGCRVRRARDGGQADGALREQNFEVVFLDLEMPGQTGLELLRSLRDDPSFVPPPIVVLSGSLDARDEALEAGAQAFVVKPVRARVLLEHAAKLSGRGG